MGKSIIILGMIMIVGLAATYRIRRKPSNHYLDSIKEAKYLFDSFSRDELYNDDKEFDI